MSKTLEDKIREIHYRVQEKDTFAVGEQYLVHCACKHGNKQYIWKPGDAEPDWKCPTLKALEEVQKDNKV